MFESDLTLAAIFFVELHIYVSFAVNPSEAHRFVERTLADGDVGVGQPRAARAFGDPGFIKSRNRDVDRFVAANLKPFGGLVFDSFAARLFVYDRHHLLPPIAHFVFSSQIDNDLLMRLLSPPALSMIVNHSFQFFPVLAFTASSLMRLGSVFFVLVLGEVGMVKTPLQGVQ